MAIVRDLSLNGQIVPDPHIVNTPKVVARSYAVTLSDSVDLPNGVCEAINVGVAGTVKVTYANGVSDTMTLPVGRHNIAAKRIWSTGTSATTLNALY